MDIIDAQYVEFDPFRKKQPRFQWVLPALVWAGILTWIFI